ncbi:Zn-dependent protease [Bacillus sp. BGMRC 2118]|nr:Zn-dependent protease [Bacillus sp. BGMRC 2118]
MSIIKTDSWLKERGNQPIQLCEYLLPYFEQGKAADIYQYLASYGMYKPSILARNGELQQFIEANHWSTVKKLYHSIQKRWSGPDIPVFILPLHERNAQLMKENGKSGLAFKDKLFLFLPREINPLEIKALLVHEYHHVCRLNHIKVKEEEMTLLDVIILEGLAEYAVKEMCGKDYNAKWTSYYSKEKLEKWWKTIILPKKDVKKSDHEYNNLLYGRNGFPKMLGYCIGAHIINKCMNEKHEKFSNVERMDSKEILKIIG